MEESPEKQYPNDGSPEDTNKDHSSVMTAIDFIEVLARSDIVFTGYLSFGISPMVRDVPTVREILNMSSFHYVDEVRMKETSVKRGISI